MTQNPGSAEDTPQESGYSKSAYEHTLCVDQDAFLKDCASVTLSCVAQLADGESNQLFLVRGHDQGELYDLSG